MGRTDTMRTSKGHVIELDGRRVEYLVVPSRDAQRLRVRVGPHGVEVIQPSGRTGSDVESFLVARAPWVLDQLRRVERLGTVRRPEQQLAGHILFRGVPTRIRVEGVRTRSRGNKVAMVDGEIVVRRGERSTTPAPRSLERWLREQARSSIEAQLSAITPRLQQQPDRVYVMGQRTKWGNCSGQRNLSFNWRLILAPEFVLRYLVTHEAVHLAVPDHSKKFWLTVQSLCPETERAKQWLCANHLKLVVNLGQVISDQHEREKRLPSNTSKQSADLGADKTVEYLA
jgi:predicted metal-dependent hydrolase